MNRFEIRCTAEQTRKALKLGAPIDTTAVMPPTILIGEKIYSIPTVEEMIGWLEEQGILIDIDTEWYKSVLVYVWDFENKSLINNEFHGSRKEAILAAIDAALEYITNQTRNDYASKRTTNL